MYENKSKVLQMGALTHLHHTHGHLLILCSPANIAQSFMCAVQVRQGTAHLICSCWFGFVLHNSVYHQLHMCVCVCVCV